MVQKTKSNYSNSLNAKALWITLAILFIGYLVTSSLNKDKETSSVSSTYVTQCGYKASYNEESLHKLVQYSVQKDYTAIEKLFYSREIFELPAGKEAFIVEYKSGRVKIRLKGESIELWTLTEAIKKSN